MEIKLLANITGNSYLWKQELQWRYKNCCINRKRTRPVNVKIQTYQNIYTY